MKLRITSGEFRGRKIVMPDHAGLRPTSSKAREALFNMLGDISDWKVLDLFAGSGLIGLEALSRGAGSLVSIESDPQACRVMRETGKVWNISERWQVLRGDVMPTMSMLKQHHFELIFADPPYKQGYPEKVIEWLDQAEISCRLLCIEESATVIPVWPEGWMVCKSRRYGESCLHIIEPRSCK